MGFKRPSDNISLSQLLYGITTRDGRILDRGTGLSKPTLLAALRSLTAMGVIVPERHSSRERGDEPTSYSLRLADASEMSSRPVVKNVNQGGGKESSPGRWSRNLTTQDTGKQQTGRQQTVSSKFNHSNAANKRPVPSGVVENTATTDPLAQRGNNRRPAPSERVEVTVRELSAEFDDASHAPANCTQALRLLQASGLAESAFESRLYEARSVVRDELHRRRHDGQTPVRRAMAYFFSVLRRDLGA